LHKLVLATRQSPLALAQAERVAAWLGRELGCGCEFLKLVTTGDRQADWSLEEKGGKGLFTRELEAAVLRGDAAAAVHSSKDLPGEMPAGLTVAGYLPREDPRDVLVLRTGIAAPRTLATGSPRRRMQAAGLFPDLAFSEIRGNVDTRLKKIADRHVADGTILAAAGLNRLGIESWPGVEFHALGWDTMVPAVGQGAIAIQCRTADAGRLGAVLDAATARGLGLERALQAALGGGCHTAFGAYAAPDTLHLFHERVGRRTVPISDDDFAHPAEAAARILRGFSLIP
jgi:hydroxymethylbilane synthase